MEHNSTVAYSTCKCGRAAASLERAVRVGMFEVISSPGLDVLRKVITAGHSSDGMSPVAKRFLAKV